MTQPWYVVPSGEQFFVARRAVWDIHVHPIPFATEREAARAADRLNARDAS
jgi:hypothetical protein